MLVSKFAHISSTETCLHREHIGYVKLMPHAHASGWLFWFMDRKPTGFETEVVTDFAHQVREDASLVRQLFIVVSVYKYVFTTAVAMQIQVKYDFSFFLESPD